MKLRKLLATMLACLTVGAVGIGMASCETDEMSGNSTINSSTTLPNSGNTTPTPNGGNNAGNTIPTPSTKGLEYTLSSEGTHYIVTDYTGADTKVYIPTMYKNLPVKEIGKHAFEYCSSLTEITIPDSVTFIGNTAFRECRSLTEIVIPDSVTEIDYDAFENCSSLTSATIGKGVTSIAVWVFAGCSSLTNITVDESNTAYKSIDGNLYSKDGSALIQYAIGKTATNFTIPDSVTSIGYGAFYASMSLTEIIIPNSVTSIGRYAFRSCSSLTKIVIPNSVTSIVQYAFYKLSILTIYCEADSEPDGWDNDWNDSYCPVVWNCNNNDIANDGYIYIVKDGVRYALKDGEATVIHQAINIKTANILSSITYKGTQYTVTAIGNDAFSGCDSLTEITIPDSVTSIGSNAFEDCDRLIIYCEAEHQPDGWKYHWNYSNCLVVWNCNNNDIANDGYIYMVMDGVRYGIKDGEAMVAERLHNITSVNIPSHITYKGTQYTVTAIGNYAFSGCDSLTKIVIPNSVTSIGGEAFSLCDSLTKIVIPNSVTRIYDGAFAGCSSLTNITVGESNTAYKSIDGNLYSKDGKTLIQYTNGKTATNFTIPDGVTSIGYGAFYACRSLTEIVISDSVTSIGEYAFGYCSSLTEIVIPNSVTLIDAKAFSNCFSLTKIVIPDSVTSICERAFRECSSLTQIVIPDSVTYIGPYVFEGCSNFTIYCEADSKPDGFHNYWSVNCNYHVVWGYTVDN